jgi:hypothetical protein
MKTVTHDGTALTIGYIGTIQSLDYIEATFKNKLEEDQYITVDDQPYLLSLIGQHPKIVGFIFDDGIAITLEELMAAFDESYITFDDGSHVAFSDMSIQDGIDLVGFTLQCTKVSPSSYTMNIEGLPPFPVTAFTFRVVNKN